MNKQPFRILMLCSAFLLGAASAQQTQPGQGGSSASSTRPSVPASRRCSRSLISPAGWP